MYPRPAPRHMAPRRRSRARSRGALIATSAVLMSMVVVPQAAVAAPPGGMEPGIGVSGITSYGEVWLGPVYAPAGSSGYGGGAEVGAGSDRGYCVQAGYDAPHLQDIWAAERTLVADPGLAWIVGNHQNSTDALTQAAISYIVHVNHDTGTAAVSGEERRAAFAANTPASIKARADELAVEAAANAGPYRAGGTTNFSAGDHGEIRNILVLSDAGNAVPGKPFTITLTGPAVFDSTGTRTFTGTTTSSPQVVPWTATGSGTVSSQIVFSDLGRVTLTKLGYDGTVQDSLTYGFRPFADDPVIIVSDPPPVSVSVDFQPIITTQVVSAFLDPGQALTDQVTVTIPDPADSWPQAGGANIPFVVTGTLYGPYDSPQAPSATVPAGAPVAGTASGTFATVGAQTLGGAVTVAAQGYYAWTWQIRKADQPAANQDFLRADYSDGFFTASERGVARMDVDLTSQVVDATVTDGVLRDDVTVTTPGLWLTDWTGQPLELTLTGTVFGPFEAPLVQSESPAAGAPIAGVVTVTASGPGTYGAELPTTEPGAYTWVWDVARAHQSPTVADFLIRDVVEDFMIPEQTQVVPFTAEVTSVAFRVDDTVDTDLGDDLVVVGFPSDHGEFPGTGVFGPDSPDMLHELFFFPAPLEVTEANEHLATLIGSVDVPTANGPVTVLDDVFQVQVDEAGTPVEGTYVFVTSFPGDARVAAFRTSVEDTLEQIPVVNTAVGVTTVARSDEPVIAGSSASVWDTADVTGTVPVGATLGFELHHWTGEPVCDDTTLVNRWEPFEVTEAGPYESTAFRIALIDQGSYGFVETLYDRTGEVLVRGECALPAETIAVEQVSVTTRAHSDEALEVGKPATVWDVATVSGTVPQGATIGFDLYHWDGVAAVCDEGTHVNKWDPVAVASAGDVTSAKFTVDVVASGSYGFVETLYDRHGAVVHRGECGAVTETLNAGSLALTGSSPKAMAGLAGALVALGTLAVGVPLIVRPKRVRIGG